MLTEYNEIQMEISRTSKTIVVFTFCDCIKFLRTIIIIIISRKWNIATKRTSPKPRRDTALSFNIFTKCSRSFVWLMIRSSALFPASDINPIWPGIMQFSFCLNWLKFVGLYIIYCSFTVGKTIVSWDFGHSHNFPCNAQCSHADALTWMDLSWSKNFLNIIFHTNAN